MEWQVMQLVLYLRAQAGMAPRKPICTQFLERLNRFTGFHSPNGQNLADLTRISGHIQRLPGGRGIARRGLVRANLTKAGVL